MTNSFTPEDIESARKLFAGTCDFMRGAPALEHLPPENLTEIAFAGRSNVGKSSLVNALTGRNTLARTSNTPGRTQELNYFNLGDKLYLVDMPGYGYAKVSREKVQEWTQLVFSYLRSRATLRCVFVLIDARHGLKDSDFEMMDLLGGSGVSCRIVLTKSDKVKTQDLKETIEKTQDALRKHPAAFPHIAVTSAQEGNGIPELRATIASYCIARTV